MDWYLPRSSAESHRTYAKIQDQKLIAPRKLGADSIMAVAIEAATVVYMDFRPIYFAEPSKGIADFAAGIF
jgi:hypothetical protein